MLEGLLIFPRLARKFAARFTRIGQKHGVFPSIEMLDAFRYGKINKPLTHSATEKSTSPRSIPLRMSQKTTQRAV
jgi:hypothetical protein